MRFWLAKTWARKQSKTNKPLQPRLVINEPNSIFYCIGDIHGCIDLYLAAEQKIIQDATHNTNPHNNKIIILLGDLIDRGLHSARVIDTMTHPPPQGFKRICLRGNHEDLMLSFIKKPKRNHLWLYNGGLETLASYGIYLDAHYAPRSFRNYTKRLIETNIPQNHIDFMKTMPLMIETQNYVFAHAGINPLLPLDAQNEHDLLWGPFAINDHIHIEKTIVHGHVITTQPKITKTAISIDTGAYRSGKLTTVRLQAKTKPVIL